MSGPAYLDIPVYHGDTLTRAILYPDEVDLTGFSALFQIRKKDALIADWSEFVTVTSPTRLEIEVPGDPDPDGTGALPRPKCEAEYAYDLQLTSPSGTVRTILRGNVILTADISHG